MKKGINFLLEAVAQLKEQMEGYVIRIAGEGDDIYIDELKQLTVRLGISKLVIFEGGVYGNSKWELFRQADLFILPTHSENFGIVVAEALASGTPVVTTMGTPWSELESRRCAGGRKLVQRQPYKHFVTFYRLLKMSWRRWDVMVVNW